MKTFRNMQERSLVDHGSSEHPVMMNDSREQTQAKKQPAGDDHPELSGYLDWLPRQVGGQWTGVRFDYGELPPGQLAHTKMRLCAAIAASFSESLVLPASSVLCPGARRSLGILACDDEVVRQICKNTPVPPRFVASVVKATPRLADPVVSVSLGKDFSFDVAVAYAQPAVIMDLLHRWQGISGVPLTTGLSVFLAVCGNAVVAAHETGRVHLALGCPMSRREGVLDDDIMVIAIPRAMLTSLFPREQ